MKQSNNRSFEGLRTIIQDKSVKPSEVMNYFFDIAETDYGFTTDSKPYVDDTVQRNVAKITAAMLGQPNKWCRMFNALFFKI